MICDEKRETSDNTDWTQTLLGTDYESRNKWKGKKIILRHYIKRYIILNVYILLGIYIQIYDIWYIYRYIILYVLILLCK